MILTHPFLGERAGGPTRIDVVPQPALGWLVVDVVGIQQRDQDVHVQ